MPTKRADGPEPPASVVAVAALQFVASGLVLLGWVRFLWGWFVFIRMYPTNHQVLPASIWIFYIALPVGFSLLGLVSSVGLFGLREWARQRTIFLSTVPVSVYTILLIVRPPSLFSSDLRGGEIFVVEDIYRVVIAYVVAVLIPVSLRWLILMTRSAVKDLFQSSRVANQ